MREFPTQSEGGGSNPTSSLHDYKFGEITKHEALDIVVTHHYAHRKCPISWAWGIRDAKGVLLGVLTVGKPVSWSVMCSLVGETPEKMKNDPLARSRDVFELNRLWLSDSLPKNLESRFIGWCLRELKKLRPNLILVSYADGSMAHVGVVYQATNWTYTGLSARFEDISLEGYGDYRSVPQELRGGNVYSCKEHGQFPTAYSKDPNSMPKERPCPTCGVPAKRTKIRSWAILEFVYDAAGKKYRVVRIERTSKHRYVMCLNSADKKFLTGIWTSKRYPKQAAVQAQAAQIE